MYLLSRSTAKANDNKYIDASGHQIPDLLKAILKLFPLDAYVYNPVVLMDMVNSDKMKGMEVSAFGPLKLLLKAVF